MSEAEQGGSLASQPKFPAQNEDDLYPEQTMRPLPDYTYEWNDYAQRRFLARTLLFLWAPVSVAAFVASRFRFHVPFQMIALILIWSVATVAAIVWAGRFRCPRCRRRVGSLGRDTGPRVLWRGLFDKVCPNCHLHRFEQAGEEDREY